MSSELHLGKYRGVVTNNQDPQMKGRIKAKVPDVLGDLESGWAMPCAPFGGKRLGFFALPDEGAGVWIEFEHGDPEYPVWTGCWWGSKDEMIPAGEAPTYDKLMMKTRAGHSILIDDSPGSGGIKLQTASGQKFEMTSQGIEIDNGQGAKISLKGPKVTLNDGALEVM
jgi:uncharacterized protein involved in type VI secretion and phage assembly